MRRWIAWLAVLAALAAVGAGTVLRLSRPFAGFEGEILIDIPAGASSREIARLLASRGVVRSEWDFLAVRVLHRGDTLQAGEYSFRQAASVWEVYNRLRRGDVHYYSVTVPEGYNTFEIAKLVGATGVISGENFLAAAREAWLIRDLAPGATSLEGYLFPDTYHFTRRATAADLCLQMTQRFRQTWESLGAGSDVHRTVTIASLIEKETGIAHERAAVSSVIYNRLEEGIPLQIDPTVVYAGMLEGKYRGAIHQSDLDRKHPYNTYQRVGLPPGPIANPGRASLQAALRPAETRYIYFVARPDGSGTHVFSETLAQHERAVKEYRRGLEAAKKARAAG